MLRSHCCHATAWIHWICHTRPTIVLKSSHTHTTHHIISTISTISSRKKQHIGKGVYFRHNLPKPPPLLMPMLMLHWLIVLSNGCSSLLLVVVVVLWKNIFVFTWLIERFVIVVYSTTDAAAPKTVYVFRWWCCCCCWFFGFAIGRNGAVLRCVVVMSSFSQLAITVLLLCL